MRDKPVLAVEREACLCFCGCMHGAVLLTNAAASDVADTGT
jgi:hypothetical protein